MMTSFFRILTLTLFTLMFFAGSLFGFRDCVYWDKWCQAENDAEIAQQNREAMERLVKAKLEFNRDIAEARAQFFQAYPDGPGVAQAEKKLTGMLHEKDLYYLFLVLFLPIDDMDIANRRGPDFLANIMDQNSGGKLDGGIRPSTMDEFHRWTFAVKRNMPPVKTLADVFGTADRLKKAVAASNEDYLKYVKLRDYWEFNTAGKTLPEYLLPAEYNNKSKYGEFLYCRYGELPLPQAAAAYAQMVKLLGQSVVEAAADQVRMAPKITSGARLVVTAREPVTRTPSGNQVPDYNAPAPENIIGTFGGPLSAFEALAIRGDDRRYLLGLLTDENRPGWRTHIDQATKWQYADTTYRRFVIAFGEADVLQAAHLVRTATKRATNGSVMDPKAIGATRSDPYPAFEDIVTRKNPRGYVRSILAVNQKLDSAAAVDAAYAKLIAASNENTVLEAARAMAADKPHANYEGDLDTLAKLVNNPQSLERPSVAQVDNPDFLIWKGFSAGAKASYVTHSLVPERPGSTQLVPGPIQVRYTLTLKSIAPDQANVWLTETVFDRTGAAHPPHDTETAYPAKIQPPNVTPAAVSGSGQEILDIQGRKISTRWQSASPAGNCGLTKIWTSDEVPGGLVRKREEVRCRGAQGNETTLESFEGSRQPGSIEARIEKTDSAPPAPVTSVEAPAVARGKGAAASTVAATAPLAPAAPVAPGQEAPYVRGMPNYSITSEIARGSLLQYCRGIYNPTVLVEQSNFLYVNRVAVEADVQKCLSAFDPLEVANHRRIAMRFCFVNNNYTERFHPDRLPAYEQCMRENDTLTAFCSREVRYRAELTGMRNLDDQKCPAPKPTGYETMAILNGGPADLGRPVVIPTTGPGLPAILLSPIEPGTLQRALGKTTNAQPVPTPSQPVPPAASRTVQPQPAPVSPAPAPVSPQERQQQIAERQQQARERARQYAECRQQAAKDHPAAGAELMKAFAACAQVMQAK